MNNNFPCWNLKLSYNTWTYKLLHNTYLNLYIEFNIIQFRKTAEKAKKKYQTVCVLFINVFNIGKIDNHHK